MSSDEHFMPAADYAPLEHSPASPGRQPCQSWYGDWSAWHAAAPNLADDGFGNLHATNWHAWSNAYSWTFYAAPQSLSHIEATQPGTLFGFVGDGGEYALTGHI